MKSFSILIIAVLFSQFAFGQSDSTSSIQGKITDKANKQPLMFASITIYKAGFEVPKTGTETDLDGNYSISNLDTGLYDILISYVGYTPLKVTNVEIPKTTITIKNFELEEGVTRTGCCCFYYEPPLIRLDHFSSGRVFSSEDIKDSPTKN